MVCIFHELSSKESEQIYEDDKVVVCTIPLKHRIYTNGFFLKKSRKGSLILLQYKNLILITVITKILKWLRHHF
jgi:ribonuclease Z